VVVCDVEGLIGEWLCIYVCDEAVIHG